MNFIQYVSDNSPFINIPDLLNLHHSNPLGISPIVQLVIIFLLSAVMYYFNWQIRNRDKQQYYPLLYTLLGVTIVVSCYYCFMGGLPEIEVNGVKGRFNKPCIGWFCQPEVVGWGWTIATIILLAFVIYSLLCAVMQATAQISVEGGMLKTKKWKEWKWALAILLLGMTLTGVSYTNEFYFISPVFASWSLIGTIVLLVLFTIYKIIADSIRCHNVGWGLLIGITFLIGILTTTMFVLECLRGLFLFIVLLVVFFSRAKASKKKPKES